MRPVATPAALLATFVAAAGLALGGAPGWASSAPPSTDLTVKLATKAAPVPGKRVTYQVVVTNKGSTPASRVQTDFTTSTPLSNVTYSIKNGHCYRSAKETACLFYAALAPHASASVAISGGLPATLPKGATVNNQVTVQSSTRLVNTADDRVVDNYVIAVAGVAPAPGKAVAPNKAGGAHKGGVPNKAGAANNGGAPVKPGATPPVAASPSPQSKIVAITQTASHWLGYSKPALRITYAVLAAAALWFGLGLWLRRRQRNNRIARGEYGDEV